MNLVGREVDAGALGVLARNHAARDELGTGATALEYGLALAPA